jgi:tRNA-specific 2-thiouridylase
MSGGVDSSVAIALLQQKYEVVGVTFRFFGGFDPTDSRKAAEQFGIEHHIIDRQADFRARVISHFCDSYIAGLTPNPCARCNKVMKFPALFDAADDLGIGTVATGHYARSENGVLKQAVTETGEINPKDQSYMLYALTPEQLSRIVFPLGELSKAQIRKIAAEHGLSNADKPDSQDICFIPDGDYASFIQANTDFCSREGDFICNGAVIGKHKGHIRYTVGQRRGLGVSAHSRLFVTGKDPTANTVTVGNESDLFIERFFVNNAVLHKELPFFFTVKTRYGIQKNECSHIPVDINKIEITLKNPLKTVAPGQCAVFYDGDSVIGGGIIADSRNCS